MPAAFLVCGLLFTQPMIISTLLPIKCDIHAWKPRLIETYFPPLGPVKPNWDGHSI